MLKRIHHYSLYLLLTFTLLGTNAFGNIRADLAEDYHADINVREVTTNCSPEIAAWSRILHLPCGLYWCAIWVNAKYYICGIKGAMSAWSPDWFPKNRLITYEECKQGDVGGIYSIKEGRIFHMFFIDGKNGRRDLDTYEGNSNAGGSNNGIGVFHRLRDKDEVYAYADWIDN